MTSETRFTVDLADVRAIDLLCKACTGSVALNPKWRKALMIPISCPSCGETWLTEGSEMHRAIRDLLDSIRTIGEMEERNEFKFELRVTVPHEPSDRASGEKD
jgi:hypothetical protein